MTVEKETIFADAEEMQKAREHNEQISARYRQLQNEIENQFSNPYVPLNARSSVQYAPVQERRNAVRQEPQVTEFTREEMINTPVFTMDKFEKAQGGAFAQPMQMQPSFTAQEKVAPQGESYGLSSLAKMLIAGFTVAVAGMLALACINTQIIENKTARLQNLQLQKQELIERSEEIRRNIEKATSEDVIREYAQENGMIKVGE